MKKQVILFIYLFMIILLSVACNKEDFKIVNVGFCLEHPEFNIKPAVFDTLIECVLLKEAHNEGAEFKIVTEQLLTSEGFTSIKIMDIQFINVVADAENNTSCAVPCIDFFQEAEFEYATITNRYETRSFQRVLVNGTGSLVEAQYGKRSYLKLKSDASIESGANMSLYKLVKTFNIPEDMDFDEYWRELLIEQGVTECGGEGTYWVL